MLEYGSLKLQEYFFCLYPSQARIIFKWRCETLDLKSHLTYKYDDLLCRKCKIDYEEPCHVINCGMEEKVGVDIDVVKLNEIDDITRLKLKQMTIRIGSFIEKFQ